MKPTSLTPSSPPHKNSKEEPPPPLSASAASQDSYTDIRGHNSPPTLYSINNTSSRDNNSASCVNIKIKSKGSSIRSLQAIIDTGNNLPHILLSMEAFTALRAAGIAKADLQETSIQATSADSNEIEVLGTIDGSFTLYIGKKITTNIQRFLVIKNLQHAMNIGIRFLQRMGAKLDFEEDSLTIGQVTIQLLQPKKNPSFLNVESVRQELPLQENIRSNGSIRAYNKKTTIIPPQSVAIIQLKLHSKEDRLNANQDGKQPATLEIETDGRFAEAINLTNPLNAVTSPERLLLPIANETDQEIVIRKNKRVGTISVLQVGSNETPTSHSSPGDNSTSNGNPPTSQASPDDNSTSHGESTSNPTHLNTHDDESIKLKETILDDADQEHFSRSPKERRDFILSALKLNSNKLLNKEEVEIVVKLMLKHWRILDSTPASMRIGKISGIKHKILLKQDAVLSHEKPRPLNPIIREEVEKTLRKWEKQKVIERCNGFPRHTSPLVPVLKKDGHSIRPAIDFRKINAESINQVYPIASIQEALANLAGNSLYSVIDGQNAYLAIELEEDCKDLTGISTTIGSFFFNRLPFGLQGATQTYSQAIANALEALPKGTALPYLDDSICPAKSFDEMVEKLDMLFGAFGDAGIIINAKKTSLFQDKVDYLGFEVSKNGIGTVKSYTEAITKIPPPSTVTEAKSILGKFTYYKRFIEGFSEITRPIVQAYMDAEKSNHKKIKVSKKVKEAVELLKEKITSAPILAHPDWKSQEPFRVKTDFSCKALGAKITQFQEDSSGTLQERVILYDSRRCTEIESRYQSNKGELLAFIWACQKHRFLLYPRKFIFVTDHIALKAIKTMAFPRSLSLRWLEIVANFNFTVEYRKAALHTDVDFLSRHVPNTKEGSHPTTPPNDEDSELESNALIIHQISWKNQQGQDETTEECFKTAQEEDEIISEAKSWITSGKIPEKRDLLQMPIELRQYLGIMPALQILPNGVLVRKKMDGDHPETKHLRPCIPTRLQEKIIARMHQEAGHIRLHKLFHLLLQRYWLPTPTKTIMRVISQCLTCQKKMESVGHKLRSQKEVMYSTRSSEPMEMLYLDFFGKLNPQSNGYSYILSCRDSFSRFIWLLPTKDMTATTVINTLNSNIFSYFGLPCSLKSDNSTSFTNNLLKEVCTRLQISTETIPPFNYWSNITERFHLDLGRFLRSMLEGKAKDSWSEQLPWICLAANSTIHTTTQLSPFFLMFGRQPNLPIDIAHRGLQMENRNDSIPFPQRAAEHAARIVRRMAKAFQSVKEAWKNDIDHRSRAYSGIAPEEFKVGTKCLIFTPSRKKNVSDKLTSGWSGPFIISKKLSEILYKVKADPSSENASKPPRGIISLSRMKLAPNDSHTSNGNSSTPSNVDEENDTASPLVTDSETIPPPPQSSEEDENETSHFPHEYEALYESHDERSSNSNNNETSPHENES